ncbi:mediator of RNA polymerase II transcription subunit 23 [Selaginella moellendorffii]|uniref:mediator of RNA polymerase II transcription subunit 23 n=1 Tax=Selaginella moellendorffii TaxID=88036 RepID=UPI000D1CB072|nr:mediator of RNA polymerase II transcription subunit 23 [Selaginella moellendorffii]|eukprot:XP_024525879.1 mediator of RNA polymerase II transcription subunit 23 [Selaginella moellendorffii]
MDASAMKSALQELFDLYLGRNSSVKGEGAGGRENATKQRKKASTKPHPPNEQFQSDYLLLQNQFMDHNQLQAITESLVAMLFIQCGSHAPQADFLLFALRTLARAGLLRSDMFLLAFFRAVAMVESNPVAVTQAQSSPLVSTSGEPSTNILVTPSSAKRASVWLRPLVCNVMGAALEAELRPVASFDMLYLTVQWINDVASGSEGSLKDVTWLDNCLEVLRMLIDERKCRVPFYALLHDQTLLQADYWPENEALLGLFLDLHRRRDRIALHMLMFDHHLQCPTFSTLRSTALTYAGAMGEALYGEEVAASVQRDSLDYEKALRCLKHGLRTNPSADIWRRVLVCAPRHRQQQQPVPPRPGPNTSWTQPGLVFNSEMTCEAVVERIMDLMQPISTGSPAFSATSTTESGRWQEWLNFADLFYYFMRRGYLDFLEFIEKLAGAFASGEQSIQRSNHVTWLLAQVFRLETVTQALSEDEDSRKVETAQKILSFHMADRSVDHSNAVSPQAKLLDYVGSSQILRLWALNRTVMEQLVGNRMPEHIQKGKTIDEWWKKVLKGERFLDYANLDDNSMGMVWVLSHTMTQPVADAVMNWMRSNGVGEVLVGNERIAVVHETSPLPIAMLSGLSLHLCMRLIQQIEEQIFAGQMVPSIAMLETYVRLLLVAPQTLFQHHLNGMMQKYQSGAAKAGISLILLELLNYRLMPLYRFHGKLKQLVFDMAKIIIPMKAKRGDHRLFRLAENLGINLVLSMKEVLLIKKEKGATTEFTETLNRIMVVSLAITIKTRGIAEFEQLLVLQTALEQILANSKHTWSEKTMRHFPQTLREVLALRSDGRLLTLQTWQQVETTVLHQCQQLLAGDPAFAMSFVNHSFPPHRPFLCAAAWVLMDCRPENFNCGNLGKALKELSPEDVTSNIYMLVDILLHHMHLQLQHGHSQQDLLLRASATLTYLVWSQEILPFDILLLALLDRDDDIHALRLVVSLLLDRKEFQQLRVQNYCRQHGQQEHWLHPGPFQRVEPPQALGNHLAGKERYPVFFDDMALRALPVIHLVVYRLIENDATDTAEHVLTAYSPLLRYHPTRFTFVRDTLAYFYGHLPNKLILRLLSSLDIAKMPVSEAFIRILNTGTPPYDYYVTMLLNLVNNVIPSFTNKPRTSSPTMESFCTTRSTTPGKSPASSTNSADNHKAFYHHQDPGSYCQLVLETCVIELLSLPTPPAQAVAMLVQIAVRVPTPPSQAYASASQSAAPRSPLLPTSPPSACTAESSTPSSTSVSTGQTISPFISPQVIQACGLLLAQLPRQFHDVFYKEVARILKDCWWLKDPKKTPKEMDAAFGYSVWDPSWAVQDGTSSVIGNAAALFHAFTANISFEWLENTHDVVNLQRPMTTVAQLRLAFRMLGPLVPRFVISRPLFAKTLALLFTMLAEVFGRNAQVHDVTEITDLVDFMHHVVMLEAQQAGGKPRPDTLGLCNKAVERLHPDVQHLFQHLTVDPQRSIYAATHPKIAQRPLSCFATTT